MTNLRMLGLLLLVLCLAACGGGGGAPVGDPDDGGDPPPGGTDEITRGDIDLRTEAHCAMWSDATTFYLTARIEAYENGTLIYARDVDDAVPRDHL